MRPLHIETWALRIIDRVRNGQPNEDIRVELKAEWPDPVKAARRIAGHANAAQGEPILWLIGVDEKRGPVGVVHEELADWYTKVQSQFDGLAPRVTDINVPLDGKMIVALQFDTDRAPFVVRNAEFGKPGAGPVQLEVPWREHTSVRSARVADLLRLLIPQQSIPDVELLAAKSTFRRNQRNGVSCDATIRRFVTPRTTARIVIPRHRCDVSLHIPGLADSVALPIHRLSPPPDQESLTIHYSATEVIIDGPGVLYLWAEIELPIDMEIPYVEAGATLSVKLVPIDSTIPIELEIGLDFMLPERQTMYAHDAKLCEAQVEWNWLN